VSRGRIIAGVIALVVVAAVVGGVLYSSAQSGLSVTTAKASTNTLSVLVTASGKIEGARRSDIYPPTAGLLKAVDVSDGETVTAGQTLAVMDTKPLTLQVRQAQASLASARAQLDAVNKGVPTAIDKSAASAQVSAASSSYDAAAAAYAAFEEVVESAPATAQASMEATLTQLAIAKKQAYAGLQQARSGRSKLSTAAKVSLARAAADAGVDAASSALALAKDTLSQATLTSPIDGVVVFNPTGTPGTDSALPRPQEGSAVAPGSAPFTVTDLSALSFNAQVDEADIAKVSAGMKVDVTLDAFPGTTFPGTVSSVRATAIQTTTGGIAFPVLVRVSEGASRLLVGMSGSADIQVNAVTGALTVPIEAVLNSNGKNYVFVLQANSTVKQVEVTTGALTDTSAQILSGIHAGDTVVTSQLTSLKDGMTVRPQ
jgi:RND family efflux transporter MFP subunit